MVQGMIWGKVPFQHPIVHHVRALLLLQYTFQTTTESIVDWFYDVIQDRARPGNKGKRVRLRRDANSPTF